MTRRREHRELQSINTFAKSDELNIYSTSDGRQENCVGFRQERYSYRTFTSVLTRTYMHTFRPSNDAGRTSNGPPTWELPVPLMRNSGSKCSLARPGGPAAAAAQQTSTAARVCLAGARRPGTVSMCQGAVIFTCPLHSLVILSHCLPKETKHHRAPRVHAQGVPRVLQLTLP